MLYGTAQFNGRGRQPPSTEDRMCFKNLMEQCDLFAVFDGHSGSGVARYTVEVLPRKIQEALKAAPDALKDLAKLQGILKQIFIEHDKELARNISKNGDSGSTATVALITPTHVVVAYIGDSPCFIMHPGTGLILPGGEMGKHEPTLAAENARIMRAGGSVELDEMGVARVDGLMVSRAFGDFSIKFPDLKNPPYGSDWTQMKVTAHPDILVMERPGSGVLAIMSDGLVETDTTILKPLSQVAVDIFNALKANSHDLPAAARTVVSRHVRASCGSNPKDYDGDDLSLVLVDVGKTSASQVGGSSSTVVIQSALNSINNRILSRKSKGKRRNKTNKTNRLIKMFTC
jgi:serine/threonine protein phosphatase PrpC